MRENIEFAVERVTKEWCNECNHTTENGHCDFKEFSSHCAIANLIIILKKDKK